MSDISIRNNQAVNEVMITLYAYIADQLDYKLQTQYILLWGLKHSFW